MSTKNKDFKIGDTAWYSSVRQHPKTGKWEANVRELIVTSILPDYLGSGKLCIGARQKAGRFAVAYRREKLHFSRLAASTAAANAIDAHISELTALRLSLVY